MALKITKKYDESQNSWVLDIAGEIDLDSSQNFKSTIIACIDERLADLILNVENLSFIDSTGLGAIINAYKKIGDNHKIVINHPRHNVAKLLGITGLDTIVTINHKE